MHSKGAGRQIITSFKPFDRGSPAVLRHNAKLKANRQLSVALYSSYKHGGSWKLPLRYIKMSITWLKMQCVQNLFSFSGNKVQHNCSRRRAIATAFTFCSVTQRLCAPGIISNFSYNPIEKAPFEFCPCSSLSRSLTNVIPTMAELLKIKCIRRNFSYSLKLSYSLWF